MKRTYHLFTVKPPKRGHFGTGLFVPSSEVVPFWEVGHYLVLYHTIGTVATYSTQIMDILHAEGVSCLEIHSYVRGYHAYKRVCEPARGEALLVRREPTNPLDKYAVAIYKEDITVGHVYGNPFVTKSAEESHMSPQPGSQTVAVFAEITGSKVNGGAGYGLEVPCLYIPPLWT